MRIGTFLLPKKYRMRVYANEANGNNDLRALFHTAANELSALTSLHKTRTWT